MTEEHGDAMEAYVLGLTGKDRPRVCFLPTATGDSAERTVRFNRKIPIYIMYFTTWVDDDGTVNFFHDVYGKDRELDSERQKLDTPAAANPKST